MSRAPFVMPKATSAFDRNAEIYDTTIGWRFVNPKMRDAYGDDTMPSTAENVAEEFQVSREDQDTFALRSQAEDRRRAGQWPARRRDRRRSPSRSARATRSSSTSDEHPRLTSLDALAALKPIVRKDGIVTAGNASGVNDGAAALIIAVEEAAKRTRPDAARPDPRRRRRRRSAADHGHRPGARRPRSCSSGSACKVGDIDVIELNEAFAAQGLAVLRQLGLPDDDAAREPQRRRDRARPPARHVGRAAGADRDRGIAAQRRPLRARHHVHRRRPGNRAGAGAGVMDEAAIWAVLETVPDPEIPVVSVIDLGIVRAVAGDKVTITPTYSGCPATECHRADASARRSTPPAIATSRSRRVLSPPWTTDWISEQGKAKLRAYGIAPPDLAKAATCPQCGSTDTEEVSRFGSTPCKAQWRCKDCLEPFDRFKCH